VRARPLLGSRVGGARAAAAALVAVALLVGRAYAGQETALERYVRAPDAAYQYRTVGTLEGDGYRAHVLEMTSQTWRASEEVDRTVWKHWLTVVVPRTVRHRTALLYLSGGTSTTPAPKEANPVIARIAVAAGAVGVYLQQVPNQPLTFRDDTEPRREDALMAYAWDRFLRTKDATWLPRLPMTKSAVRAMDTVVDFCATPEGGGVSIESFVVAGSSKRGWTTWTTAVVDPRVVAIVPMVIDLLNLEASFRHHYRAYGFWSPAIQDYLDFGIPDWFGTREFRDLMRIEDPYRRRDRLRMPKLIVNATGDPLFLPDSSRFYFADLRGEKHLRYVPNADHSLNGTDAFDSLLAFFREIVEGTPRPAFTWRFEGETSIRVRTEPKRQPSVVRLWQASNPEARDFRLSTLGAAWTASPLEPRKGGVYVGSVTKPDRGWTAFFIEMTYPGTGEEPLKLTTEVRVVPDTLPYRAPAAGAGPTKRSDAGALPGTAIPR
jgi:PhoPQ-activated pathogenicity-related protein